MGPHFFKCGKRKRRLPFHEGCLHFNGAALFQVRKAILAQNPVNESTGDFNGAALFQVRKAFFLSSDVRKESSLQWGRTFSSAERRLNSAIIAASSVTSMGPHFFKCGKLLLSCRQQIERGILQWGRTFSSAERLCTQSC